MRGQRVKRCQWKRCGNGGGCKKAGRLEGWKIAGGLRIAKSGIAWKVQLRFKAGSSSLAAIAVKIRSAPKI